MTTLNELSPASLVRKIGRHPRALALALGGVTLAAATGVALAQDSDQQVRCMQLQQELASAQGGGGGGGNLAAIDKQIADANRVFQGTKAAMEDAGCFERFFIFGQGLVRSPKCISMNDRVEDSRRQIDQLQDQRAALAGGGGNRRRQADLQDALARNGCGRSGAPQQQARRDSGGGGLFGWFGGSRSDEEQQPDQPQTPVYHSIDPNGRYRSVCVRTCDGFFFPISYSTYTNHLAQDATACQSSCAAPAELYVYRNPGGEIEQAISLNGTAYSDLPNAFKYRKEYVKGCSCKEAEYNPTEIEANQKAEAEIAPDGKPAKPGKQAAQTAAAPAAAAQPPAQLNLNVPGAAPAPAVEAPPPDAAAAPSADAAPAADAPPATDAQQSSVAKQAPAPQ